MIRSDDLRAEGQRMRVEAIKSLQSGDSATAEPLLGKAVLIYAATEDRLRADGIPLDPLFHRQRAELCLEYGSSLLQSGRNQQAAFALQEATDIFLEFEDDESKLQATECARLVLQSLAAVNSIPWKRLDLLVVKHERKREQLALFAGNEAEQATICIQIARIFQRQDRYSDAVERYLQAANLYSQAEQTQENSLLLAECHQRLASVYEVGLCDPALAAAHYAKAIELFQKHEKIIQGSQLSLGVCQDGLDRVTGNSC